MPTTFATKTICQSNYAIATIESQIVQLQSRLTTLQEQRQAVKSAEQQGLSAINQYKMAIAAIAQLNEPEMLQSFLEEMATITNDAIGNRSQLPDISDEVNAEPVPVEPETPEVNAEPVPVEPETPPVESEVSLVTEPADELVDKPVDIPETYANIKFTELKSYAAQHGIKTRNMNKAKIAIALDVAGHSPSKVELWLVNRAKANA